MASHRYMNTNLWTDVHIPYCNGNLRLNVTPDHGHRTEQMMDRVAGHSVNDIHADSEHTHSGMSHNTPQGAPPLKAVQEM
jgi:hypothetical protein